MVSTYSTSLRLELMATGDQSGTWGVTTNTNLGTLLEQAITGVLSVSQGDVANLTLTNNNGASDQARNALIDLTGAMSAARNVVVPAANKLYFVRNSTTGGYSVTVKTNAGTGIAVPPTTGRWLYCDGTNVLDAYAGPFTPSVNDGAALGLVATAWSDLFLASGGVINWASGDATITHATDSLTLSVAGAGPTTTPVVLINTSGVRMNIGAPGAGVLVGPTAFAPVTSLGSALGDTTHMWAGLFLGAAGVINWDNGDVTETHSTNLLTWAGATNGYVFNSATGGNTMRLTGAQNPQLSLMTSSGTATMRNWAIATNSTTAGDFQILQSADNAAVPTSGRLIIQDGGAAAFTSQLTVASTVATPAAGSTSARLLFGTTAGFGIYYGSGAPTVSAAQGSIYLRSDGSSTATRLYVNTNGTTGWTNFTSAT